MTRPCRDVRPLLVAHVRGDLSPLEATLVEAHAARCPSCAAVRDELAAGLEAAREEPPVDVEHLVALVRAAPGAALLPEPRRARRFALPRRALAAAVALAASSAAAAGLAFVHGSLVVADGAPAGLTAGAGTGVEGRIVRVDPPSAPSASSPAPPSTGAAVAAASRTGVAGDGLALATTTLPPPALPPLARARSVHRANAPAPKHRPSVAATTVQPALVASPAVDVDNVAAEAPAEGTLDELLPLLDEAERLGRSGDGEEALARYQVLEKDGRFARHVDLIAYERARLEGLVLGDLDVASRELDRLAHEAHGHVATEAALTRCEVERKRDPCAAVACLDAVDGSARADARRLRDRWSSECASP